jgi:hypothetical protein
VRTRTLLATAAIQKRVILSRGGLEVARDMAAQRSVPQASWSSVEFTDGPEGTQGGLGILRSGKGQDATMLLMKYGVHGQGHGHFDKLHFTFFDAGTRGRSRLRILALDQHRAEVRWTVSAGETTRTRSRTIAHNTVVVDQRRRRTATTNRTNGKTRSVISSTRRIRTSGDEREGATASTTASACSARCSCSVMRGCRIRWWWMSIVSRAARATPTTIRSTFAASSSRRT